VELSKILGLPKSTVSEYLSLLKKKSDVKKKLEDLTFRKTKINIIKSAPEKYQRGLRQLVVDKRKLTKDDIKNIVTELKKNSS
jgi:predicted transcriptional regulator